MKTYTLLAVVIAGIDTVSPPCAVVAFFACLTVLGTLALVRGQR